MQLKNSPMIEALREDTTEVSYRKRDLKSQIWGSGYEYA